MHEAETVEQAFEQVRRQKVDVIFCDWVLNPGSGIDFVLRLRRDPESPNPYLPVIMMSAHADRVRIEQARDAGATEFLVKPITISTVLAKFVEIVERPRPFIRCDRYFGPDRRRRQDPRYKGPDRRQGEAPEVSASVAESRAPTRGPGQGAPETQPGSESDGETVLL